VTAGRVEVVSIVDMVVRCDVLEVEDVVVVGTKLSVAPAKGKSIVTS
jgi:hypothetical protein